MTSLSGKKILITGATSGIGLATALSCLEQGAHIAFCGLTQDGADEVISAAGGAEQKAFFQAFDIADQAVTRQFVKSAIDALGGLDGVVNNAGQNFFQGIRETSYEDIIHCLNVNFFPAWVIAQEAYEALKASGKGKFIVVSSIHGMLSLPGAFPYDISKAALTSFVRSMALSWSKDNILTTAIAPGLIRTPLVDKSFATAENPEAEWDKYRRWHPVQREGMPGDVASLIVYLLSDSNQFITGNTILADGGLHIQIAHD